jgi:hypothetical protein
MSTWLSGEVVAVRIRELTLVSVGRSVGQTDCVTRLHELPMQLDIPRESSLESLGGGVKAQ